MKEEFKNRELKDDQLEKVGGGLIFYAKDIIGADPDRLYEVLDDTTGEVMARASSFEDAEKLADELHLAPFFTEDWDYVQDLRKKSGIN